MNITEMADLNPYPAYKYSGNPWLGKVPIHWNTARLKQVCTQYALYGANVQASEYSESGIRFIRTTDITEEGDLKPEGVKVRPELVPEHILTDGDILLSRSGTIGRSFQYQAQRHGPCSYAGYLVRFAPGPNTRSIYLYLCTRTPAFQNAVQAVAISSTIENVNAEKYASITIPLPPLDEQAAIVRYLDGTDQLIRAYVSAKERLIALLEEERQAVIHQAVTKGLDPNVKLKPSGVEWLGDVPEQWTVRRLKTLCSMKSGNGITTEAIEPTGKYPVYGGNGLRGYTTEFTHDGTYALIGRQGALCGNVHTAQGKFWASEHAVVASLHSANNMEWFVALLEAMNLNQYSISAAQPGLAVERIANLWSPVPPHREQARTGEYIAELTAAINDAIDRARCQIELIEEYRTRLIADVVTGKIDVRETKP